MSEQQVAMASPGDPGGGFVGRAKDYFVDLRAEMRRVTWPTWPQVQATTAVVIATVFAFAAYFFVIDMVLGQAVTRLFDLFGVGRVQ